MCARARPLRFAQRTPIRDEEARFGRSLIYRSGGASMDAPYERP